MLYVTPVDESMEALPSPEELKMKIIIKAKKQSETTDVESASDSEDERDSSDSDDSEQQKEKIKDSLKKSKSKEQSLTASVDKAQETTIDSLPKEVQLSNEETNSEENVKQPMTTNVAAVFHQNGLSGNKTDSDQERKK